VQDFPGEGSVSRVFRQTSSGHCPFFHWVKVFETLCSPSSFPTSKSYLWLALFRRSDATLFVLVGSFLPLFMPFLRFPPFGCNVTDSLFACPRLPLSGPKNLPPPDRITLPYRCARLSLSCSVFRKASLFPSCVLRPLNLRCDPPLKPVSPLFSFQIYLNISSRSPVGFHRRPLPHPSQFDPFLRTLLDRIAVLSQSSSTNLLFFISDPTVPAGRLLFYLLLFPLLVPKVILCFFQPRRSRVLRSSVPCRRLPKLETSCRTIRFSGPVNFPLLFCNLLFFYSFSVFACFLS